MLSIRTIWVVLLAAVASPVSAAPDFDRDVKPLLEKHCIACHGAGKPKGGLDLRTPAALLHDGLTERLTDGTMPPENKPRPTADELKLLRASITAELAKHKETRPKTDHWAFRKLVSPAVPTVKAKERVRTPVDTFLLAKLEAKGLTFASDAEKAALIRRLTFDLHGLPPTPEEVANFLADTSASAYETLVNRLLASPHYGERWGRHWLDAAGYADTIGTDNDVQGGKTREGMWRYRDYVVRSLNADKPFDRFLTEQLAGDQLFTWDSSKWGRNTDREKGPDPEASFTAEQKELLIATGFLRTAVDGTNNYERDRPLERFQVLHDTVEIVTSNIYGLTVGCARCHDHKYDPVSQRDYYKFMAFLTPAYNPAKWIQPQFRHVVASTKAEADAVKAFNTDLDKKAGELGGKQATIRRPHENRIYEARFAALPELLRTDLKTAQSTPGEKRTEVQKYLADKVAPALRPTHEEVTAALTPEEREQDANLEVQKTALRARHRDVEKLQTMWDVGPAPVTALLRQGSHETPGREVEPGLPAVLAGSPLADGPRRLALAKGLTEANSYSAALIARAQMNRLWHHHFGRGIVSTPGNLGKSGASPTHPELLDYLASEFIKGGWKLKAMHRLIVTSTAYRQTARPAATTPETVDPENLLLWKTRLRRLESEAVRDAILTASGQLDRTIGGAFIPLEGKPDGTVAIAKHADANRRSLYLYARRNFNLSLLAVFDQPLVATNCTARKSSAVVPQALTLLNDPTVIAVAEQFARKVAKDAATPEARIELAFRRALSRAPTSEEASGAAKLLAHHATRYAELSAGEAEVRALSHLCQVLFCTNEFLYVE
ncbi:MAG: PSD1 and planctomycete cytochrome C domain-containing protein [Planctomycetes bacterium]|nr:PSD1 and planctomycete cytochrome C domain-containing protein [Planctomycetota bacterium]